MTVPPSSRLRGDDRGAMLVTSLALSAVLVVVALVGGVVADLVAARQRAATAADLGGPRRRARGAAVGVGRVHRGGVGRPGEGATLRTCAVVDGDVRLTASPRPRAPWSRWLAGLLGGAVEPTVSAHAGLR